MSNAVVNDRTGELTLQGRLVLEATRAGHDINEIARQFGVREQTIRVYLSRLRRAGFLVPVAAHTAGSEQDLMIMIKVAPAVAAELRQQAMARRLRPALAMGTVQKLIDIIHQDDLYDAVLGDMPRRAGDA